MCDTRRVSPVQTHLGEGPMTTAPAIAPVPKHPSRSPYPMALSLMRCATVGSSAKGALAQNMRGPLAQRTQDQ